MTIIIHYSRNRIFGHVAGTPSFVLCSMDDFLIAPTPKTFNNSK